MKTITIFRAATFILLLFVFSAGVIVAQQAVPAQAGKVESGKTVIQASPQTEMPPALSNMKGTPGFDAEYQRWQESQKGGAGVISQDKPAVNPQAQLEGVKPSVDSKAPYYLYKGISDPEKAKQAWYEDSKNQKPSTK